MLPDVMPQAIVFNHVTLSTLDEIALRLVEEMGAIRVCVFNGEMGAGKTTIIKAIGRALKVKDRMSSPTFSIVNEYRTEAENVIYHFDFYRIKSESEAFDIGTEEYFYSGNYCFVEWPDKIPSLLPETYMEITLYVEDDTHRTIEISLHGRKEEKRV